MRPDARFGLGATLVVAAGAAAGAAAGYLAGRAVSGPVAEALALRPPVVALALAAGLEALPPAAWGARIAERTDAARRLARAGYLVLDAQAVVAAPEDLYLAGPASSGGEDGAARGRSRSGDLPDPSGDSRSEATRVPDELAADGGRDPWNGLPVRPGQGAGEARP